MIRWILLSSLLLASSSLPTVYVIGTMRSIMRDGNLAPVVSLDTISSKHLYGLGPVGGLHGELLVLDGKIFQSSVEDEVIMTRVTDSISASMFVYSYVSSWTTLPASYRAQGMVALEEILKQVAASHDIPARQSFAFMLQVPTGITHYHVIDWKLGAVHAFDNHRQFARAGTLTDEAITVLGFWSGGEPGVFTGHASRMHLHLLNASKTIVGHIDDLAWNNFRILLPVK